METVIMILVCWCVSWFIGNFLGDVFPIKLKIFKNKYKDNINPIYKLEWDKYSNIYKVYKYKLDYGWDTTAFKWYYIICPLLQIFIPYTYIIEYKTFGEFTKEEVDDKSFNIDLENYYELHNELHNKESLLKYNNISERKLKVNNINKIFNENYK